MQISKRSKLLHENLLSSNRTLNLNKKKEQLSKEYSSFKTVNQKLEEICRDYTQKNKEIDTENITLPKEEDQKRKEFMGKFDRDI